MSQVREACPVYHRLMPRAHHANISQSPAPVSRPTGGATHLRPSLSLLGLDENSRAAYARASSLRPKRRFMRPMTPTGSAGALLELNASRKSRTEVTVVMPRRAAAAGG